MKMAERARLCFYDDLPEITSCDLCTMLVAQPNVHFTENCKKFVKRQHSSQTLIPVSICDVKLLECSFVSEVVNLVPTENQV